MSINLRTLKKRGWVETDEHRLRFFEDAMEETMDHPNSIAQQIRALGHIPTLCVNLSLGGGPMRLEAALAEALDVEQQALDAYKGFLPRVAATPRWRSSSASRSTWNRNTCKRYATSSRLRVR